MPIIRIAHEFEATDEAFFALFFGVDHATRMYLDFMKFPEFSVTQLDEDDKIRRTVVAIPKMELPAALAKVAGGSVRYREEGVFDKKTKVYTWKTTPSILPDKIRNEGVMRVEALGNGKIRRSAEITLEAKVFGLGGLIESTFEKTIRDGWEKASEFFRLELAKQR